VFCAFVQLSHVISGLTANSRCLTDDMLETLVYSVQLVTTVSVLFQSVKFISRFLQGMGGDAEQ